MASISLKLLGILSYDAPLDMAVCLPVPQGQPHLDITVILGAGFFLQQSGVSVPSLSCSAIRCCFFFCAQQQVWFTLLSREQPQIVQSPEHSPDAAWATLSECRDSGASGLRIMTT
jgi:hypothetical protein